MKTNMQNLYPLIYSFYGIYEVVYKQNLHLIARSIEELAELALSRLQKIKREKYLQIASEVYEKCKALNLSFIDYYDTSYPPLLKEIYDPPIVLFYKGNKDLFLKNYVAIVGTRKPSHISRLACHFLPSYLRTKGFEGLVSGMASGIDRASMLAALEGDMPVIGVLGTGLDKEYPSSNRDLYEKMNKSNSSLLISEMFYGENTNRWSFPRRNRIITGLCSSVYIMEAPAKSGAISSAYHALSQNRDIYIFTHPEQKNNAGGEKLLSEGANRVQIENIGSGSEQILHISDLVGEEYCRIPSELASVVQKEMQGKLQNLGDGYYRKAS